MRGPIYLPLALILEEGNKETAQISRIRRRSSMRSVILTSSRKEKSFHPWLSRSDGLAKATKFSLTEIRSRRGLLAKWSFVARAVICHPRTALSEYFSAPSPANGTTHQLRSPAAKPASIANIDPKTSSWRFSSEMTCRRLVLRPSDVALDPRASTRSYFVHPRLFAQYTPVPGFPAPRGVSHVHRPSQTTSDSHQRQFERRRGDVQRTDETSALECQRTH